MNDETETNRSPSKWWQWILIYPSLLIAVLGAIPTLIEAAKAYRYDVPIFTSAAAEKQVKLWERNIDCLKKEVDPNSWTVTVTN